MRTYDVPIRVLPPNVFGEDLRKGLALCAACKEWLPRDRFSPSQLMTGNRGRRCRECRKKERR